MRMIREGETGKMRRAPLAIPPAPGGMVVIPRSSLSLLMATDVTAKEASIMRRSRIRLFERIAAGAALALALVTVGLALSRPPSDPAPSAPGLLRLRVEITPIDPVAVPPAGPIPTSAAVSATEVRAPAWTEEPPVVATVHLPGHGGSPGSADPVAAVGHLSRAQDAFIDGELDAALREARRAIQLGAGADALVVKGNVHFTRRQYARAEAAFLEAQRLSPDDSRIARKLRTARAMTTPGGTE
jgi:hypothetical protein